MIGHGGRPADRTEEDRVHALELVAERGGQRVDAFHQRPRQLIQRLAGAGGHQPAAAALEQLLAQFPLQRLQLQGDGGLGDEQRLRGA